jgi:hypothetical protein
MTNGADASSSSVALVRALALVLRAQAVAADAMLLNPSREQERALNETLLELDARRAMIQAMLNALASDPGAMAGPTAAQVTEVSLLTGQVETLTTANLTASSAITFTSKVLVVATQIAGGPQNVQRG